MAEPKLHVLIPSRSGEPLHGVIESIRHACSGIGFHAVDNLVSPFSVCTARNKAVQLMLGTDSTHLLFVDDDVYPPPESAKELLELNAPIATGCVPTTNREGEPYIAVAKKDHGGVVEWHDRWFRDVVETPVCGMAYCLIRRDVLEKLGFPWFEWSTDHDLHAPIVGEDVYFCRRVREEGLGPIKAHGRVRCRHKKRIDVGRIMDMLTVCNASS